MDKEKSCSETWDKALLLQAIQTNEVLLIELRD